MKHRRFSVLGSLLLGLFLAVAVVAASKPLCADKTGVFLGLATDEDSYTTIQGAIGDNDDELGGENDPQNWVLTKEESPRGSIRRGPKNSYDGRFLQVLPDSGRTYPGQGQHLSHPKDLEGRSPCVTFELKVTKEGQGVHTAFLRWTGGDTVGGGDSLYVVLYKKEKKGKRMIHGQQTVKPAVVPIDAGMSRYAGCCYDTVTHACPCYSDRPDNSTCPTERFIDRERAGQFGVQCLVGGGAMTIVHKPEWYLYAGQEEGDVMDFDSEPWDATCEADGSNTRDSGHDTPTWWLDHGLYELRIYAREDGTALDGIYIAGPTAKAPTVSKRYSKGDSTICVKPPLGVGKIIGVVFGIAAVVGLGWWSSTQKGQEILGTVLSKPSQAVRYVYVDNS